LKENSFPFEELCEIRSTQFTWTLKYDGSCTEGLIEILLKDTTLSYLEINKVIFKNELMQDKINNNFIRYNPLSFRQSDDSIKYGIYQILEKNITDNNLYFIGGEMVFYSKLFEKINKLYMITDYESIYEDAKRNSNKNDFVQLINYEKDELIKPETVDKLTLIANTSKQGLGKHLSKEILKLEIKNIFIISCNQKSFYKDYEILKKNYKINKVFELKTNYVVTIYLLVLRF
jgi:hypothetical protein